jgi:hypothetical protein
VLNSIKTGKPVDLDTPNGQYSKLDELLPKNESRYPVDRARENESMLDWFRVDFSNRGMDPLPDIPKIGYIPVSIRTTDGRKKQVDSILDWIRAGTPAHVDSPTNELQRFIRCFPRRRIRPLKKGQDILKAVLTVVGIILCSHQ